MTTYQDQQKEWAKRRKLAVRLRKRGMSYAEIGRQFDPPVTAQAIRRILIKEGVVVPGVRRA